VIDGIKQAVHCPVGHPTSVPATDLFNLMLVALAFVLFHLVCTDRSRLTLPQLSNGGSLRLLPPRSKTNPFWVLYFLWVAVRYALELVHNHTSNHELDRHAVLGCLMIQGCVTLFLTLSLHRAAVLCHGPSLRVSLTYSGGVLHRDNITIPVEGLAGLLFGAYEIAVFLVGLSGPVIQSENLTWDASGPTYYCVYFAIHCLQYLLALYCLGTLVWPRPLGPTRTAKALSVSAFLLSTPQHIPLSFRDAYLTPRLPFGPCIWIFSWHDVALVLYAAALGLYFGFVGVEHNRYQEAELCSYYQDSI